MSRPKTQPDGAVLEAALALLHAKGPQALTFAALAAATGLSGATLVQRFGSKQDLARAALLHAWDRLDAQTAQAAEAVEKTPQGAVDLLVALSRHYGGLEAYADGLLLLREDLRDPQLRARGVLWGTALRTALDGCFSDTAHAPPGIGRMLAAHWQGVVLWWGFDPREGLDDHVAESLAELLRAVGIDPAKAT